MLHNIFFSHGILRKGWKENKEKKMEERELLPHSPETLSSTVAV